MRRLQYIDWLRGFAVVVMIEAHTIDSWTVSDPAVRALPVFKMLQFIAGWAAPLFVFLAGVSVSLAAAAHVRKGRSIADASWRVQKRGWQVLGLAYLFRLQSFLLAPTSSWRGMLKVDILNVMGVAMAAAAFAWARARTPKSAALWLLVPAALCILLGQYTPGWTWLDALGGRLQGYFRPVGSANAFSLFPWAAFVFAGAWVGTLLSQIGDAAGERAFQIRIGATGAAVFAAAYAGQFLPTFTPHSEFWTSSTSWALLRLGAMLMLMPLAWLWMRRPTAAHWSPMLVFGQTSLFVYWVHVEIVYGFPTYPLRHELSIPQAIVAYLLFATIMLGLAVLWRRREKGPLIPSTIRVQSAEVPGFRSSEVRVRRSTSEPMNIRT